MQQAFIHLRQLLLNLLVKSPIDQKSWLMSAKKMATPEYAQGNFKGKWYEMILLLPRQKKKPNKQTFKCILVFSAPKFVLSEELEKIMLE